MLTLNENIKLDEQHDARILAIEIQRMLLDPQEVIEDSPAALDALVQYYLDGNKARLDAELERIMWDYAAAIVDGRQKDE